MACPRNVLMCMSLGLFVVAAGACGAATTADFNLAGQKTDGGRCSPGNTQDCVCLGGGMGTQTCRASGSSYGPCTGCGNDDPDGGIPSTTDGGGSACGDCDGCCNGTTCVKFADEVNGSCGARGQTCAPCTGTKICDTGTGSCVDAAGGCGACTNNCCDMVHNVCLQNSPAACGTACTKCTYGVTCSAGACTTTIDSNAYFKVYVKTAQVLVNTTTCKDNWDFVGEPNLKVYVGYQSGGTFIEGKNTELSGTLNGTWDDTTGVVKDGSGNPVLFPASAITAGKMRITLVDVDTPDPDDVIGQGYFPGTTTYVKPFHTGPFGCVTELTFELR